MTPFGLMGSSHAMFKSRLYIRLAETDGNPVVSNVTFRLLTLPGSASGDNSTTLSGSPSPADVEAVTVTV
jgi:hypothetical protein